MSEMQIFKRFTSQCKYSFHIIRVYGIRTFGFWFRTKLMLGTGKSSHTKTRRLLQGVSCHLSPSLNWLSWRDMHASLPHPLGLKVPSGWRRPVGPVVLQLLNWFKGKSKSISICREDKRMTWNFKIQKLQTLTNLFEIWLVGGIIFRLEAQNHPLMWRGWNLGWSHPSTSPSQSRPAVEMSFMPLVFIKLCINVCSASVSRLIISMHI